MESLSNTNIILSPEDAFKIIQASESLFHYFTTPDDWSIEVHKSQDNNYYSFTYTRNGFGGCFGMMPKDTFMEKYFNNHQQLIISSRHTSTI